MGVERILVFTRTTGYRHGSIPYGVEPLRDLGAGLGLTVEVTVEPGVLVAALDGCRAVVFLSTSGEALTAESRDALPARAAG
ncbi:ThuA domain-containing protein [Streptomyces sp. CNQ085]|uniref:ThuA domain-containing protein n=1 Tax=Streptomyces sp. CNQ085 TaxID=2886944 RepID=UPI0027E50839|nr:ThuA domain-containing protein [Streptomyces sp. CNQ085]